MKYIILIFSFFTSTMSLSAALDSLDQIRYDAGKQLYKVNCKACHALDQKLVGPALKGVLERRDSNWIYQFVQGSQAMIAAGDPTAVSLFGEYNQVIMPNQNVSVTEINSILNYIHIATLPKGAGEEYIPRPVEVKEAVLPLNFGYYGFWIPFTLGVMIPSHRFIYMLRICIYPDFNVYD